MKTFVLSGAILVAMLSSCPARAEDCTEEARKQVSDLAAFSKMAGMDNCTTADGKALYERDAALLKILNQRNQLLSSICPDSDARWTYARKTLQNLTRMFAIASRGCGG